MKVSFQGVLGAYSHLMATQIYPNATYIGYDTFAETIRAVETGMVDCAVIPIQNSTAGKVQDACDAITKSNLIIVSEHDLRIHHQLWGLKGAIFTNIKEAHSHPQALAQCDLFLKQHNIKACINKDTAFACQNIVQWKDKSKAAIASELAGKLYGLHKLSENIEDLDDNTTHFVVLKATKID